MKVTYTSKNDLIIFAKELTKMFEERNELFISMFNSELLINNLMTTNSWVVNNSMKFVYKIRGYDVTVVSCAKAFRSQAQEMFGDFIHHLVHGKNIQSEAAGGFSQTEIYMIQSILTRYKEHV